MRPARRTVRAGSLSLTGPPCRPGAMPRLCHTAAMLIDTHCHLDFPDFDADRDAVIARARAAGVEQIVIPAIHVDNFQRVLALAATSAAFYPALGLHPCFIHPPDTALARLDAALTQARAEVVAVGEIGLDFRPGQPDPEEQLRLFEQQLALACRHDLPVLLHVVRAHDQVLKQLRRRPLPRGGIVHAFSGSEQQARQYAELGFRLGFGGALTHPRAQKLRRLAARLPLEWLVLETDAPDMPPAGSEGPRNEPARLAQVAGEIAQLRGEPLARIAEVTAATAQQLLRLADH